MFRGMEFLSVKQPLELWFSECHPEKSTDGGGRGTERVPRTAKQLKETGKPNLGATIRKVSGKPVKAYRKRSSDPRLFSMDVP